MIYDFFATIEPNTFNTILEAGGHRGTDTRKLCELFNNAIIYVLEPNISLYNEFIKPLTSDKIKTFNLALDIKNGTTDFYLDLNEKGDNGASSILESQPFYLTNYIKNEKKISVEAITLSKFIQINNIDVVDLLWLDIEGFEYFILENSIDILHKIKYIYTEVNFVQFRKNSKLYNDIKNFMENHNFEEIYKEAQGAPWGEWQGNILFKNKLY